MLVVLGETYHQILDAIADKGCDGDEILKQIKQKSSIRILQRCLRCHIDMLAYYETHELIWKLHVVRNVSKIGAGNGNLI